MKSRLPSGVAELCNPTVTAISGTSARVVSGQGASRTYSGKDGSGKYASPADTAAALVENAGGGWTELATRRPTCAERWHA